MRQQQKIFFGILPQALIINKVSLLMLEQMVLLLKQIRVVKMYKIIRDSFDGSERVILRTSDTTYITRGSGSNVVAVSSRW